jgi:hypothetical protein
MLFSALWTVFVVSTDTPVFYPTFFHGNVCTHFAEVHLKAWSTAGFGEMFSSLKMVYKSSTFLSFYRSSNLALICDLLDWMRSFVSWRQVKKCFDVHLNTMFRFRKKWFIPSHLCCSVTFMSFWYIQYMYFQQKSIHSELHIDLQAILINGIFCNITVKISLPSCVFL